MTTLSREIPVDPSQTALLFVDVQNYCATPDGGEYAHMSEAARQEKCGTYFDRLQHTAVPAMVRLQRAARRAGIELLYTVIESLTPDGRDRSLDYKISGLNVPRGSRDAQVIDAIRPADSEIVIPKTSSSVFISTNIDYVLRNLGIRQLIVCGVCTEQCVESAVRDACDLGYLVTLVPEACATYSEAKHHASLAAIGGYCRQVDVATLERELAG